MLRTTGLTIPGLLLWTTLALAGGPDVVECSMPNAPIADTLPPVEDDILVTDDFEITDVQVSVDLFHTFIGDLDIQVQSPDLTVVQLHEGAGGSNDDINVIYSDAGIPNGDPYQCGCPMQPSGPGALSDFDGQSSPGTWTLVVIDNLGGDSGTLSEWCLEITGISQGNFIRGDVDGNGTFSGLPDGVFALNYQFTQGSPAPPCMDAADADNSGTFSGLVDASYVFNLQFIPGSPLPPPPYPGCGPDDDSALGCAVPPAACNP